MKARTKLILAILVPFLVSVITYYFWYQSILEYETRKWGEEEPPPSDLSDALEGYPIFLSWIAFRSGLIGSMVFGSLGVAWIHYFIESYRDYCKKNEGSVTRSEVPNN